MDSPRYRKFVVGVIAVFGGFLVQISLGGVYTYGSMFPYILQYMQNNVTGSANNDKDNVVWILGLAIFGRGASMTLGSFIENKLGTVITILLGGGIMSLGYLLTYLTIRIHLIMVAITYGLLVGMGTGIAYGVSMTAPSEWFPKHRGLMAGIILAGFGIGSLGFDLIQAFYINTDLTNTNLVDPSKVPLSFVIMGCVYFFIQIIGVSMIKKPVQRIDEDSSEKEFSLFGFISSAKEVNLKPHQLIFLAEFWIIWIPYACNGVVSMIFLILHRMWGKKLNFSDLKLVIATSIGGVFSIIGRVVWGHLTDRFGYKRTVSLAALTTSITLGTFYICSSVGDLSIHDERGRYGMYLIWVTLLFFLTSGNFSMFPAICVKAFGSKHYTGNFGVLFTGYSFSGIATSILMTRFFKGNDITDYLGLFLSGSGISILVIFVSLFHRHATGKISINMLL